MMKNSTIKILTIFLLLCNTLLKAQVTIGTGTSSDAYLPVYVFDTYSASEQIYLGTEIGTGSITKIEFYKSSGTATNDLTNVSIYMKTTLNTTVGTTTSLSGYTLVWSGTITNPTPPAWSTITLANPFAFTSTSDNLSILVIGNNNPYFNSRPNWAYTSTSTNYRASYYSSSSTAWSASSTMTRTYNRRNIRLTLEALTPCSGTPAPGNTVSTAASVCSGSSFTLSLQNATTGSGVTYQWQSSSNGSSWTNVSGATSSTLATTQTAATYYRCNVTCSGNTGTSNPLQVNMAGTIPFFEGFEAGYTNATAVAGCWTQQSAAGSQTWVANNSSTTYNRTPLTGTWNAYLQYSNNDWLFHPLYLTGGTTYELEFYVRQDVTTGATASAAYGTSATSASMINTIVASTAVTNGTYQKLSGQFTPASTGTYYLGINGTLSTAPYYMSIDDIKVSIVPGCLPPTGLTAGSIAANAAIITYTAPGVAPANGYEYYLSQSNTAPTAGTTPTGTNTGTTLNLSGLTANTPYYLWLRSACTGSTKSAWSAQLSFSTCAPIDLPYTENFDASSSIPSCSWVEDINNDAKTFNIWTSGSTYVVSGTNSLRYNHSTTLAANDWWYTPGLNVTAGATYQLSFFYRSSSTFTQALEIRSGTAQSASAMTGTVLFSNNAISNTTFAADTLYYTATSTGVVYFGWHITSAAGQFSIFIDDINFARICSGTPTAGTISSNVASICGTSGVATLSATGYSTTAGVSYQWQSSTDNFVSNVVNLTTVPASASTGTITSTMYYRLRATCIFSSASAYSNIISIPVYNPAILTKKDSSRCGNGIVVLEAIANSGSTVKWYTASSGGSAVNTGTTFTTPSLSTSTIYYVEAEAVAGCASTPRTAVTATIVQTPTTPTLNITTANICSDSVVTLVASGSTVIAPTATNLLAENFEGTATGTIPSGWSKSESSATTWNVFQAQFVNQTAYNVSKEIRLRTFLGSSSENGTFALTLPVINASEIMSEFKLSFRYCIRTYNANAYPFTIYVQTSDNGTDWTTAWSVPLNASGDYGLGSSFLIDNVDLSVLNGKATAYVRFALIGYTYALNQAWQIDEINITGKKGQKAYYTWSPETNLFVNAAATIPYNATTYTSKDTVYAKPAATTTYTVYASTVTPAKCAAANSVTINVSQKPAAVIASPKLYACDASAILSASSVTPVSSVLNWVRTSGVGSASSPGNNALVSGLGAGNSVYNLLATNGYCIDKSIGSATITMPSVSNVISTTDACDLCIFADGAIKSYYNSNDGKIIAALKDETSNSAALGETQLCMKTTSSNAFSIADTQGYPMPYLPRQWTIHPADGSRATVTLYFTDEEYLALHTLANVNGSAYQFSGYNKLVVSKFSGGQDGNYTDLTVGGTIVPASFSAFGSGHQVSFTVDDFSTFYIHPLYIPETLPVELVAFTGHNKGTTNYLEWQTASELNTLKFEVERNTKGTAFIKIGELAAAGNSNSLLSYQFTDNNVGEGNNYYRLKIIDRDGTFKYSHTINIHTEKQAAENYIRLYPNPMENNLNVDIQSSEAYNSEVVVYDVIGSKVYSQYISISNGLTTIKPDLSFLVQGAYILHLIDNNGNVNTVKFIKK